MAIPIRRPVNVPGPTPTAIRSTPASSIPARSSSSAIERQQRVAWRGRAPGGGSSRASSTLAGARIERDRRRAASPCRARGSLIARSRPSARSPPGVLERDAGGDPAERGELRLALRPLDERDRVGREVVGEQLGSSPASPRSGTDPRARPGPARVALADRERRAGHGRGHAERAAGAAHERRLPGAELALDQHHVARLQPCRELRAERLGLLRAARLMACAASPTADCIRVPSRRHDDRVRTRQYRSGRLATA